MEGKSKTRKLVIRLTPEQQADLKIALGIEKPCEFLEIPLSNDAERTIDMSHGTVILYGVFEPGAWNHTRTVKIIN